MRLSFDWYPWTHGLVTGLVWAVLAGIAYFVARRNGRGALVVTGLVVSHWVLDVLTHRADLPIYPGGPVAGLGLWRSFAATMIVEALLVGAGIAIYATRTRAVDRTGRYAFWALVAVLVVLFFANAYGPPPPDVNAIAWGALTAWLIPVFGWWVDRHRAPERA